MLAVDLLLIALGTGKAYRQVVAQTEGAIVPALMLNFFDLEVRPLRELLGEQELDHFLAELMASNEGSLRRPSLPQARAIV
jgi:hypothetical protein